MEAHALGTAIVEYYDKATEREAETRIYFQYLPRKGDRLTVYTRDKREIHGRVVDVHHAVEDVRRIEADITIRIEPLRP